MVDAWSMLVGNSTLGSGDAWEHLNAQGGGTSGGYVNGIYSIEYAGELDRDITYLPNTKSAVVYISRQQIGIEYDGDTENGLTYKEHQISIEYIESEQITMGLTCN